MKVKFLVTLYCTERVIRQQVTEHHQLPAKKNLKKPIQLGTKTKNSEGCFTQNVWKGFLKNLLAIIFVTISAIITLCT